MSQPKIAHVTSVHGPFDIRIFQKQCKTLAAAGYQVVLVAPKDTDETVDGVRVRGIPRPTHRLARMVLSWRAVAVALSENPRIFHLHDPELLPAGKLLTWMGKTVIYDMHENVPKALLTKPWIHPRLRPWVSAMLRKLEPGLLKGMGVIFAEHSYRDDYRWLERETIVLNLPRLTELGQVHAPKAETPMVAYIGGVTPERGSHVMLEAVRRLQAEGVQVGFQCVGPIYPDHRAELEAIMSRQAIRDVHLHGYMLPQAGWQVIAPCHIGLALLAPTPNNVDCCSTKIFEYMALGMPLVASHFARYREVIERNRCGICVDPEDPVAIAEAIRWLIEHPEEARAMGERGRKATFAHYSWETEADKLVAFYARMGVEAPALPGRISA